MKSGWRKQKKGFVLLQVLMVIAIVSVLLYGFAVHSLNCVFDAALAEQKMQNRWGLASCQRVGSEMGRQYFFSAPSPQADSESSMEPLKFWIELDSRRYEVVLGNESTKLDLTTAYDLLGPTRAWEIVRQIVEQPSIEVSFKEIIGDQYQLSAAFRKFLTFDQVFCDAEGSPLPVLNVYDLNQRVTLWGGKICFPQADEELIRTVAKELVGPIMADKMIELRKENPNMPFTDLVKSVGLNDRQIERVTPFFSDQPSTISIWVFAMKNGAIEDSSLLVRRSYSATIHRYYAFGWQNDKGYRIE